MMGNRGELRPKHYDSFQPCQPSKPWIACVFHDRNGRQYKKDDSLKYTKLFFLDEVTAFAAGHRPCGGCQGRRYKQFVEAWEVANNVERRKLDAYLHDERCNAEEDRSKKTVSRCLSDLPNGVMVQLESGGVPHLLLWEKLFPWSVIGYRAPIARPLTTDVIVLTPPSIIKTFQAGFPLILNSATTVHPSVVR